MKKETRLTIGILAIAFSFGLNITGIIPVLGMISEKYTQYSTGVIQLMQTLPYALLMLGALMVGWLTTKFSKKKIVLAGLAIIGICGVIPFFLEQFMALLITRLLIGYGFGIVGPMVAAIIAETMEPENRTKYLGLHVVGMGTGAMVCNILGANLAKNGLHYFYLVYLAAFISIVIVMSTLEETPPASGIKATDMKLDTMVYVLAFVSFLHTMFINVYSTNISMYLSQNMRENTGAAGAATAVNAALAMLVGIFFSQISGILKRATLPFSFFAAAIGYAVLLLLPSMPGVLLASALCGVSLSCFTAMGSYLVTIYAKPEAVAKASGLFSVIGSIGGLIAPVSMGSAAAVIGANTPMHQFAIAFSGMLIMGVLMIILAGIRFGEKNTEME